MGLLFIFYIANKHWTLLILHWTFAREVFK